MDYIEKISETITAMGKEVADKAKDTAEIIRLRGQISTCEEVIRKNYLEIGRLFFEQYGEDPEAPFEKQCSAIRNARNGVKELQQMIDEIKGL